MSGAVESGERASCKQRRPASGSRTGFLAILVCAAALPVPVSAQNALVLEGRLIDVGSNEGVSNAIVSLDGHGSTLSSAEGAFRFERVAPGDYTLRVEAFGYADLSLPLTVVVDGVLFIPLEPAPLLLDSIVVEAGTLDFDGRVRDASRESNLHDAWVRSDQGHDERSGWHGRFDLDDVFERTPLRLVISGFGYMPLDTTFVPDDQGRHDFDLGPDPLAKRMIGIQVQRLEARASESGHGYRPYQFRPSLDRDDMARFTSRASLQTMLEAIYPLSILRKVGCVMIDEQRIATRIERTHVLQTTLPQQLERTELLEFPREQGALMLRVYTRRFFQELVATNKPLTTPRVVGITGTCL